MARQPIEEQVVNSRSGFTWPGTTTAGDSGNGHAFVWGPRKVLCVNNATGGAVNITFTPQSTNLDVFTAPTRVVSSPNNSQMTIGPFSSAFAHPEDGDRVFVDVGAAVSLKVLEMAGA